MLDRGVRGGRHELDIVVAEGVGEVAHRHEQHEEGEPHPFAVADAAFDGGAALEVDALVLSLEAGFVQHEHEAGLEEEHRDKRADYAFREAETEVEADLEFHEHEREQTHHRGESGGRHRRRGLGYCRRQRGFGVEGGLELGAVLVQQEDGVVHRKPELQYGAYRESDDRGRGEEGVGAQVDDDGHHQRQDEDERLHQRVCGDEQYDHDHDARREQIYPHLVEHRLVERIRLLGHAAHGEVAFADHAAQHLFDLAERLYGFGSGGGITQGHQHRPVVRSGIRVAVIEHAVLHGGRGGVGQDGVDEFEVVVEFAVFVGLVHSVFEQHLHHVRPNDAGHAVHFLNARRDLGDIGARAVHARFHIAVDAESVGEELVAVVGVVARGKIGSEVVVDPVYHRRYECAAQNEQTHENREENIPILNYELAQFVHPSENVRAKSPIKKHFRAYARECQAGRGYLPKNFCAHARARRVPPARTLPSAYAMKTRREEPKAP